MGSSPTAPTNKSDRFAGKTCFRRKLEDTLALLYTTSYTSALCRKVVGLSDGVCDSLNVVEGLASVPGVVRELTV